MEKILNIISKLFGRGELPPKSSSKDDENNIKERKTSNQKSAKRYIVLIIGGLLMVGGTFAYMYLDKIPDEFSQKLEKEKALTKVTPQTQLPSPSPTPTTEQQQQKIDKKDVVIDEKRALDKLNEEIYALKIKQKLLAEQLEIAKLESAIKKEKTGGGGDKDANKIVEDFRKSFQQQQTSSVFPPPPSLSNNVDNKLLQPVFRDVRLKGIVGGRKAIISIDDTDYVVSQKEVVKGVVVEKIDERCILIKDTKNTVQKIDNLCM